MQPLMRNMVCSLPGPRGTWPGAIFLLINWPQLEKTHMNYLYTTLIFAWGGSYFDTSFAVEREREKRRYSPARHTEDNPPSTQNGGMNHISVSELSTPISNKKGSHPMSPQYDIIPTDIANHTIYDSLAAPSSFYPAPPPSLLPPNSSMSSLVKPSLLDSAHTSMGHLSEASSNMLRLKMKGSNPNVNTELTDMRESRRRSSSVPDMLDQTIDYPIDFLEPISINRDLLELEEGCGSERLARRCNGHLVGFDQTSLGLRSDVWLHT